MALMKLQAKQNQAISRPSEGQEVFLRALRDGSMISSDWMQAAIFAGQGYMINEGALVTGQTGGGQGTAITLGEPEALVSVPNGVSIMPIRIGVAVHPGAYTAQGNEVEILVAVDQDKADAPASGTCDTFSIYNLNTKCGLTSACDARGGCSGAITTPVNDLELAHFVTTADLDGTAVNMLVNPVNLVYEPDTPILINGPAMLLVYFGGTIATSGFINLQWLEFKESDFKI